MEEKPFESLARGLNKDLSSLMDTPGLGETNRASLTPLAPAFGGFDIALRMGTPIRTTLDPQPFSYLGDQLAKQVAIFPLGSHVVINQFGAFIPQSIFGRQNNLAYKEEKLPDGAISITVHSKQPPPLVLKYAQFGSARGKVTMSEDFDEPLEDFADYM